MSTSPPDRDAKTLSVRDARGRRVTMLDPYALCLLRRYDSIPPESLSQIAKEVGSGLTPRLPWFLRFQAVLCVLATMLFVIHCVVVLSHGWSTTVFYRLANPYPLYILFFTALGFWGLTRQRRFLRTRNIMLKYLRCPHCGYDIHGLPTDPANRATICPECGCAWRLPSA